MTGNKIQAVIIDDEKCAREALAKMLELYCPNVQLMGEADSVNTGRALIQSVNPDLVFLDVEMPSGTGFDLLHGLPIINARIIFTTAHDKYAINAFKISALDYLLKPIDRNDLVTAVAKFQPNDKYMSHEVWQLLREQIGVKKEQMERLVVPSLQGFEIVKVNDIMYCEGDRNYTIFHLANGDSLMSSKTLKEYEMLLPSACFIRVHQKYLVNINYVKKYLKGRGGELVMTNGKAIEVSQAKKQALIDALGQ